jgi:hypothetical protein
MTRYTFLTLKSNSLKKIVKINPIPGVFLKNIDLNHSNFERNVGLRGSYTENE